MERDTTGLKWITSFLNELYVHGLCEVVTTQRTMVDVKQPTPIRDGKSKAWLVSMHASLVAEEVLIWGVNRNTALRHIILNCYQFTTN